jgi:hypothetical protein
MQRYFECAGHLEHIDLRRVDAARDDFGLERGPARRDDVAMPRRLHEGDALRLGEPRSFRVLSHDRPFRTILD